MFTSKMLDQWMKTAGVNDKELAEAIGQTPQSIGYYRRGERNVSSKVQKKVIPFLLRKIKEQRANADAILEPFEAAKAA